jgi:hypothetical protein
VQVYDLVGFPCTNDGFDLAQFFLHADDPIQVWIVQKQWYKALFGQKSDFSLGKFLSQTSDEGRSKNNISDGGKSYEQKLSQALRIYGHFKNGSFDFGIKAAHA